MAIRQTSAYCHECDRQTLHSKEVFSQSMGCLLTVLTAGVFIPFWLLADTAGILSPYRCQRCGSKKASSKAIIILACGMLAVMGVVAISVFANSSRRAENQPPEAANTPVPDGGRPAVAQPVQPVLPAKPNPVKPEVKEAPVVVPDPMIPKVQPNPTQSNPPTKPSRPVGPLLDGSESKPIPLATDSNTLDLYTKAVANNNKAAIQSMIDRRLVFLVTAPLPVKIENRGPRISYVVPLEGDEFPSGKSLAVLTKDLQEAK